MIPQKKSWTIARILLFVIIGLFNTVLIKPEDIRTWINYVGYCALLLAVIDILFLIKQYFKKINNEN
jgi:hypothetical protein